MSYGVLSTYPPTQCGLATFSQALVQALQSESDHVGVIRVVDADEMCSVVAPCPGTATRKWQQWSA